MIKDPSMPFVLQKEIDIQTEEERTSFISLLAVFTEIL